MYRLAADRGWNLWAQGLWTQAQKFDYRPGDQHRAQLTSKVGYTYCFKKSPVAVAAADGTMVTGLEAIGPIYQNRGTAEADKHTYHT